MRCVGEEWRELETFVELAGTKSAEEDYETVKVTHLHVACAGFAPFLFEIKDNMTIKDFGKLCSTVLMAFSRDKNLIHKWVKANFGVAILVHIMLFRFLLLEIQCKVFRRV